MKSILMLAAAASALTVAGSAYAQSPPAPPRPPAPPSADAPPPAPFAGRFGRGFRGPRLTAEERAKRRADLFARMDGNKNGQVTFDEYRAFIEAERLERQKRQFERFSGGQASVTLDQLNARALQRERDMERRFQDRRGGGRGPGRGPAPGPGGI